MLLASKRNKDVEAGIFKTALVFIVNFAHLATHQVEHADKKLDEVFLWG